MMKASRFEASDRTNTFQARFKKIKRSQTLPATVPCRLSRSLQTFTNSPTHRPTSTPSQRTNERTNERRQTDRWAGPGRVGADRAAPRHAGPPDLRNVDPLVEQTVLSVYVLTPAPSFTFLLQHYTAVNRVNLWILPHM